MTATYHKSEPVTSEAVDGSANWRLLAVLCAAQFLVVLNFQTITLAVPLFASAFSLDAQAAQWVISANELTFGGLLLVAGRLSDLIGQRRLLLLGLGLYTVAALFCGFAPTIELLIAGRAAQGIAAALLTPAALALLTGGFAEGTTRTRALGVWGAVGPVGGIVGIVLGGLLAGLGWSWVFWLAVPLGALSFFAALWAVPADAPRSGTTQIDIPGALLGSASITSFTLALSQLQSSSGAAISLLALAVLLLVLFVVVELRSPAPLIPLALLRQQPLVRASLLTLLHAATTNTPAFFFVLYLQEVRDASALETGFAFLPTNFGIIAGSALGTRLANSTGPRLPGMIGMGIVVVALLLFGAVGIDSDYYLHLLPTLFLYGFGLGVGAVALNVAATVGLGEEVHGVAWGLINTAARVGTAFGLALLVAVAAGVTSSLSAGDETATDLVAGWQWAFRAAAGLAVLGVAIAAMLPRAKAEKQAP